MISLKFFTPAICGFRAFTTKSSSKATKYARSGGKILKKHKKDVPRSIGPLVQWTDEQKAILAPVPGGDSVFITGSAGTGKTVLLKEIIRMLKQVHGKSKVFVTASTGVAACALGGQTLHSFAGIGVSDDDRETLLDRVLLDKRACRRWKKAQALVIDEISMVDAIMFENLEYIARQIRESDKKWGGIQLVVTGDFFQLPPITKRSHKVFAFEADCWDASFEAQVELTKIFRQSDARLIKLLQGIRKGKTDAEDLDLLEQSCLLTESDSSAVRLYPLVAEVNKVNEGKMESLGEEVVTYRASDGGVSFRMRELKQVIAPEQLALCKGARVMLIKNLNILNKLCNGAIGTVTGFVTAVDKDAMNLSPKNLLPVVRFDSGLETVVEPQTWEVLEGDVTVAWRTQIPLILAWALSIHKCQGMTIDRLHTDLSRAFGYGMVYVALSRVRSLEGLHLSGFSRSKIKAHPKVLRFYQCLESKRFMEDEERDDDCNEDEDGSGYKVGSFR